MTGWHHDILYSLRRLAKQPVFVLAVVLSIGLGVAANVTIFSMVNRFALRPPPIGQPGTALTLKTSPKGEDCCNNFSEPVFHDVRDQAKSFSGVAAYYDLLAASIGGSSEPERVWGQTASANFFDVAQMPMILGRGFNANEENAQVLVLGYNLWRRRFNSDPNIIGTSVMLSGHPYTIVGVAPAAFHGIDQILYAEFWAPLGNMDQLATNFPSHDGRDFHWLNVLARLQPDVTRAQAQTELDTIAQRLAIAYPKTDAGNAFAILSAGLMPPRAMKQIALFLAMLAVVALLVLCIACANVANLLLARAADHQREMAVRLALGATRARLLRQMLTESMLLALGGGLTGVLLSLWAMRALGSLHMPAPVPLDLSLGIDWRVLLYAFAISFGAGLLCGIVPAWRAARPLLSNGLKGESALNKPGRKITLRNTLVVTQIAMSVVLLSATVLFLRSLGSAARIDPGFRPHNLLMLAVDPTEHGYNQQQTSQFLTQLRQRTASLPGVAGAAVTDIVPLSMDRNNNPVVVVGAPKKQYNPSSNFVMVSPGYFEALGIARLAGRDFEEADPTAPVAGKIALKSTVINQTLATQLFGKANPLGQTISGGGNSYQVIGVVKDSKSTSIGEDGTGILYRSLAQNMDFRTQSGYTLLVHTAGDSASMADAVRRQIHAMDPTLAIFDVKTVESQLHEALFLPRLSGILFGIFGLAGLLLAAVGLYGVMSYSVSRRTKEIGIRIALGAKIAEVQSLIIRQGMGLAAIAILLGLPAALAVAKIAKSFLYGIQPWDAVTFATVPAFLIAIALLASWLPSRRAATIDPIRALRYE